MPDGNTHCTHLVYLVVKGKKQQKKKIQKHRVVGRVPAGFEVYVRVWVLLA